ncbi:MAG: hypothetical protein M0Z27_02820 [Thermaerobacter sp.]|nr:hypothetical protein [Thermaerobacter sp.]
MSEYGHFSTDGREYVISRPDTPRPWINYLSNGTYCALVSQTGGGYSFLESSGFDRLTRGLPGEMVLRDRPGRYLYLLDREDGEYWGLTGAPVPTRYAAWECRHGLGYTVITARRAQLSSRVTYFVPRSDNLECWLVRLRNGGRRRRRVSLFPYVELVLGNYAFDLAERSFADLFNESRWADNLLLATKRFWNVPAAGQREGLRFSSGNPNVRWNKLAFFTAGMGAAGYETSRERFLGSYGSWERPQALERGGLSSEAVQGEDLVFSLQLDLELEPGEERELCVLLGTALVPEEARAISARYAAPEQARRALAELARYWDEYLAEVQVQTPDPELDLAENIWNKYQNWITARWSRMASYYTGGGSILGFRDTCQDTYGILPLDPALARARVRLLLSHQMADGSTLHNWDPRTNQGARTGHSDDPLWLVLVTLEFLKETGDFAFLEEGVEFYGGGGATVQEHLRRAMEYSLAQRRSRYAGETSLGISLMGAADWNDGLDQVGVLGRGESVLTTEFLAWMLREMAELMGRRNSDGLEHFYRQEYEKLRVRVNETCWDGAWYVRGMTDHGEVFGSGANREGRIYLNPQSWAVLSGIAPDERVRCCLDAVWEQLDTPYGPAIFLPAYVQPDQNLGIITRFAAGTKENGTVFTHPVAWLIIAECLLGRGDRAWEYYRQTSFVRRGEEPAVYKAEPYVYAEYVHGPASPRFGEGSFTWTTGSAAWMWRACLDYLLGVRPVWDGLLVDPCLPGAWEGCRVRRRYRGAVYDIRIDNRGRRGRGVTSMTLDGQALPGNVLPPPGDAGEHRVEVVLG